VEESPEKMDGSPEKTEDKQELDDRATMSRDNSLFPQRETEADFRLTQPDNRETFIPANSPVEEENTRRAFTGDRNG